MMMLIWVLGSVAVACVAALAGWGMASESAARFPARSDDDITVALARVPSAGLWETVLERWDREAICH